MGDTEEFEVEMELTAEDYISARYLGLRPRRSIKILGWSCLVMLLVLTAVILIFDRPVEMPYAFWVLVGSVAYLACWWWVMIPCSTRRIVRQQKSFGIPHTVTVSKEGLCKRSENGEGRFKWEDMYRFKKSESMILVYHSEALMEMLPRRFFSDDQWLLVGDVIQSQMGKAKELPGG